MGDTADSRTRPLWCVDGAGDRTTSRMVAGATLSGADRLAQWSPHLLPLHRWSEQRIDVEYGERVRPTPGNVLPVSSCPDAVSHSGDARSLQRWSLDIATGTGYGGVFTIHAPHRAAALVVDPDE